MGVQSQLPQLNNQHMTCGGGFETWLQYVDGFELRHVRRQIIWDS